jgi:hypothetical protein
VAGNTQTAQPLVDDDIDLWSPPARPGDIIVIGGRAYRLSSNFIAVPVDNDEK